MSDDEDAPTGRHEMPEDPTRNPEEALDTLEERVLGATANQVRGDEGAPGPDDEDASTSTPVTDESPA